MVWICEIAVTGDAGLRPSLLTWQAEAGKRLSELDGLVSADFYEPTDEESEDPFNHDVATPLLLVIGSFTSEATLQAALADEVFAQLINALPGEASATVSAFERRFYPVGGEQTTSPLEAPISYVVRYHHPAENAARFIKNYVDSHPPTQAKLPAIRSIMCYFPRPDLVPERWTKVDYLVGNEVVLNFVEDFNAAMKSPVRLELRSHFKEFPPFSGLNTHFLMRRRRLPGSETQT